MITDTRARDAAALLAREVDGFARELSLFPDERTMWRVVPGITNAAGNLAMHVAGNLEHYIGAVLGDTGYRRNRDAEFGLRDVPRTQLLEWLEQAKATVATVLGTLEPGRLDAAFPERVTGTPVSTHLFLMHLCVHAAFHLGQVGYLRRTLTGDSRSSQPISLADLHERLA